MDQTDDNLVKSYISANDVTGDDSSFWTIEEMMSLVWEDPERAWLMILSVIERNPPDWVLASLGAGPLEDLLQAHGLLFIDRVEQEAFQNERFSRDVLARVYPIACRPEEVAERVRQIQGGGSR